jgi:hypothetical protein
VGKTCKEAGVVLWKPRGPEGEKGNKSSKSKADLDAMKASLHTFLGMEPESLTAQPVT